MSKLAYIYTTAQATYHQSSLLYQLIILSYTYTIVIRLNCSRFISSLHPLPVKSPRSLQQIQNVLNLPLERQILSTALLHFTSTVIGLTIVFTSPRWFTCLRVIFMSIAIIRFYFILKIPHTLFINHRVQRQPIVFLKIVTFTPVLAWHTKSIIVVIQQLEVVGQLVYSESWLISPQRRDTSTQHGKWSGGLVILGVSVHDELI